MKREPMETAEQKNNTVDAKAPNPYAAASQHVDAITRPFLWTDNLSAQTINPVRMPANQSIRSGPPGRHARKRPSETIGDTTKPVSRMIPDKTVIRRTE
jgi:hypothetical protein